MDTQLPAGEVPGSYTLAGDAVAGSRRSWLDWLSDFTGFGDGQFGNQNVPSDRLEFDWSNLRAAFRNAGRDSEEIVVVGQRIVTEGPQHFGRAGSEIAYGAAEASRYAWNIGRDLPQDPGGTIARTTVDFGRTSYALASTNPATVINGFTGGYRSAWQNDGIVGVTNQAFYHAGHASMLAIGPELAPTRGLSAEETLLFSVRPNRVADDLLPEGSFSISDWWRYPEGISRPPGPFVLLEGAEYEAARLAANRANRSMHRADPALDGLQIHEVHPVKFGGSPTDPTNKIPLTQPEHSTLTTWWETLRRDIEARQR